MRTSNAANRTNLIMRLVRSSAPGFALMLATMFALSAPARAETRLLIDGDVSDWASVRSLPLDYASTFVPGSLGTIEEAKIAQDSDFIYVSLRFAVARPRGAGSSSAAAPKHWEDYSYLEIDTEGDGLWDYRTRLTQGKRPGLNNLAVLRRQGSGAEGKIVLFPEGDKRYAPLGPHAYLTPDARGVEMRIPRAPLGLKSGTVYLRFVVRFRDAGASQWESRYLPPGEGWIGLRLRLPDEDAGGALSLAREREPVVPRSELEEIVTSRYSRGAEPFIVPLVTPEPLFGRLRRQREPDPPSQGRKVRPVLIIDSTGEVLGEVPVPEPQTQEPEQELLRSVLAPE